jgi:RNA polymerase sigma-70 factor (ECF subfamily)
MAQRLELQAWIFEPGSAYRRSVSWKPRARRDIGLTDSEIDLLERCRRGEERAWRDLVERHTRRVFAIAYRFSGRVDEAEDLTQEVFVKVYQSLNRYEAAAGSFAAWLTTVARNHSIDHYRKMREERRVTGGDAALLSLPARNEGQERALLRDERAQLVRRALRVMPNDLREALVLCDLQGLPYDEIAATLGVPVGTVKSRINRGRLELAKRLSGRRDALESLR